MKKYLYLLAGLAAGFVLVFMGTAICQYLHLTQSGYVRYDDSVEVVYQQVAEYAGVDPATLSIHAKRQVGDDIFVLWKTPDRTEVSMTQLRQASFGGHTYHCPESFSVELSGPYVLIPLWLSGVPEGLYGTLYDADGQVVDTF